MREKAGWQVSFWHFRYSLKQLRGVEHMRVQPGEGNHSLGEGEQNCDITFDEVSKAIDSAKLGKAFLFVPNEALKNVQAKTLLHKLFNVCFKTGFSPQEWLKSDLKPLFKGGNKDPRNPLDHRPICIMSDTQNVFRAQCGEKA